MSLIKKHHRILSLELEVARLTNEVSALEEKLKQSAPMKCSFCAKAANDVSKLIAGPAVFICDECVGLCCEIIFSEARKPRQQERAGV